MTDNDNEFIQTIEASAHCDGPCGVYDPASARIAAEAVQSMTKKMVTLAKTTARTVELQKHINTMSRYATIKEEEAQSAGRIIDSLD